MLPVLLMMQLPADTARQANPSLERYLATGGGGYQRRISSKSIQGKGSLHDSAAAQNSLDSFAENNGA